MVTFISQMMLFFVDTPHSLTMSIYNLFKLQVITDI
jgi:hypothetical protein